MTALLCRLIAAASPGLSARDVLLLTTVAREMGASRIRRRRP